MPVNVNNLAEIKKANATGGAERGFPGISRYRENIINNTHTVFV